ncbi:MAG: non-canonical purine NTP pyrophosphatase, partial [Thermodesulfobacteriota bacterium]|nr:non-canonical purine NTP pyrophosphatase [Thermodesulfobacteriota bacterium]
GRITLEPVGEQGFGYDPLFFDQDLGMTAAQMTRDVKNARSHRGKALRGLLADWPGFWSRATLEK